MSHPVGGSEGPQAQKREKKCREEHVAMVDQRHLALSELYTGEKKKRNNQKSTNERTNERTTTTSDAMRRQYT